MINITQEQFLNDTLIMAGFDPHIDDFEMLKADMSPILDEYLELQLYSLLSEEDKAEYDHLVNKTLDFFDKKIVNMDNILVDLYINWQKEYLENFKK